MSIFAKIQSLVERIVKKYSMRDVAEEARRRIYVRTKTGSGLSANKRGASKVKLKSLSSNYIKIRKKDKKLHSTTNAKKSNLTRTGQMLNSMKAGVERGQAIVQITGTRRDGQDNADIAGYVAENGRPFFELTDKEIKGLRNQIKRDLIKALKKNRRK